MYPEACKNPGQNSRYFGCHRSTAGFETWSREETSHTKGDNEAEKAKVF